MENNTMGAVNGHSKTCESFNGDECSCGMTPRKIKYPKVREVLQSATSRAFEIGEHWATVQEPKGQATIPDFYFAIEKAIDDSLSVNEK